MKHPWVNILILVFVTVEFISGFWGLVSGSRDEAVFIVIHRIAGYGLVVLLFWKVAVILFALRNRKRGRMERTAIAGAVRPADGDAWPSDSRGLPPGRTTTGHPPALPGAG